MYCCISEGAPYSACLRVCVLDGVSGKYIRLSIGVYAIVIIPIYSHPNTSLHTPPPRPTTTPPPLPPPSCPLLLLSPASTFIPTGSSHPPALPFDHWSLSSLTSSIWLSSLRLSLIPTDAHLPLHTFTSSPAYVFSPPCQLACLNHRRLQCHLPLSSLSLQKIRGRVVSGGSIYQTPSLRTVAVELAHICY